MFDILADSFRIATMSEDWRLHQKGPQRAEPQPGPEASERTDRRFLEISWLLLGRR